MASDPATTMSERLSGRTGLLLLLLLGVAAHALSLTCGWIWDDDSYVTANKVVQSSHGWLTLWDPGSTPQYYPLVFLGFWIEHAVVGLEPFWYHLVNVLMHAGSAALLCTILRSLRVPHPFWIAALFAVHPMGVESVAWVTERKNVQSMLFALLSMRAFLEADQRQEGQGPGLRPWCVSFTCFVAALLSKTTAIFVAPCLVLALLWRGRRIDGGNALRLAPYFIVGAALGLFTAYMEKVHVGASGQDFALGFLDRMQLAGRVVVFYMTTFALPIEQVFIYPRFDIDIAHAASWIPTALCAAAFVACVARWKQNRAPLLVALWIGAALFPALGFFDVWPFRYSFVADHFAYAAMPAFSLVIVALIARLVSFVPKPQHLGAATGVLVVAGCIALSVKATPKYESEETLWRATFEQNPTAWIAANNIASIKLREAGALVASGESAGVEPLAREALAFATAAGELNPREFTNAVNRSEAYRLLGAREDALREIEHAAQLAPRLFDVHWIRGRALEALGRVDEARAAFREAAPLARSPKEEIDARRDLMRIAVARKELDDAVRECERIVAIDPTNADMVANLGSLLAANGRREDGRRRLLAALAMDQSSFSSPNVWVASSVAYLRLAIDSQLAGEESSAARAIAARLVVLSGGDPGARYLQLALALSQGDQTARAALEKLGADAKAAGNTTLADEVTRVLTTRK